MSPTSKIEALRAKVADKSSTRAEVQAAKRMLEKLLAANAPKAKIGDEPPAFLNTVRVKNRDNFGPSDVPRERKPKTDAANETD